MLCCYKVMYCEEAIIRGRHAVLQHGGEVLVECFFGSKARLSAARGGWPGVSTRVKDKWVNERKIALLATV